ncbi:unnamed protein product [Lactuca virosa]|uniref:Uncharacterized protein n=1 Tax=Lactuca virosa TaxID=75947 RepID=A0AAU9MB39_9ASTR|nr:unnamed protein product [Lactuca virosa]
MRPAMLSLPTNFITEASKVASINTREKRKTTSTQEYETDSHTGSINKSSSRESSTIVRQIVDVTLPLNFLVNDSGQLKFVLDLGFLPADPKKNC